MLTTSQCLPEAMGFDDLLDNTNKSSKDIVIHDKQIHQITPSSHWMLQGQITPFIFYQCHRAPNFSPRHSMASHLRVTGHFETNAPNETKMILNTKRSKVPHIHTETTYESTTRYCATNHSETSVPIDPQMTLNTKRPKVPNIHVATIPESQISLRFVLHVVVFELLAICEQCTEWPQMTLKRLELPNVPHIPVGIQTVYTYWYTHIEGR